MSAATDALRLAWAGQLTRLWSWCPNSIRTRATASDSYDGDGGCGTMNDLSLIVMGPLGMESG